MVNPNLYVQSLFTFLLPGDGLSEVLPERTRTWKTFQISFHLFF
jgi:hypothetical protein